MEATGGAPASAAGLRPLGLRGLDFRVQGLRASFKITLILVPSPPAIANNDVHTLGNGTYVRNCKVSTRLNVSLVRRLPGSSGGAAVAAAGLPHAAPAARGRHADPGAAPAARTVAHALSGVGRGRRWGGTVCSFCAATYRPHRRGQPGVRPLRVQGCQV